jgi:hypothetical protein
MQETRLYIAVQNQQCIQQRRIAHTAKKQMAFERALENKHHLIGTSNIPGVYSHLHQNIISDETLKELPSFRHAIKLMTMRTLLPPSLKLYQKEKNERRPKSSIPQSEQVRQHLKQRPATAPVQVSDHVRLFDRGKLAIT